jgi:hypothetical protein
MLKTRRKVAYSVSALAALVFFFFPEPRVAVVGALILQTLAFVMIAGSSPVDGLLLCAVSILLIGLIPMDHPLIEGAQAFEDVRRPLLISGAILALLMVGVILYTSRRTR